MPIEPETVVKKKKHSYKVRIIPRNCKGCGICVEFCAAKVLAIDESKGIVKVVDEAKCTGCLLCDIRCPDFAIQIERLPQKEPGIPKAE